METIDEIIKVLNFLDMDYKITHTNDYSELTLKRNNDLTNCCILFDCNSRGIMDIVNESIEEDE